MVEKRVRDGIRKALECYNSEAQFNEYGRVERLCDNLVERAERVDFERDLLEGDGGELAEDPRWKAPKFHAPHSSSALAVNCFAPFKRRIHDLPNLTGENKAFDSLRFEAKCPTGVGPRDPNLDVLLCNSSDVLGIESKLKEHCKSRSPSIQKEDLARAEKYLAPDGICDWRCGENYFKEMKRLVKEKKTYKRLDAMQLIKHAFGLARLGEETGKSVKLLYVYWEPDNGGQLKIFEQHKEEVEAFADKIKDSTPAFEHISYPCLWNKWKNNADADWVSKHICDLESRYRISI